MATTTSVKNTGGDQVGFFCSIASNQAGEELFGSAVRAEVFLLLEYPGAWSDQALRNNNLPESVRRRFNGYAKELPNCKALLIKGAPSRPATGSSPEDTIDVSGLQDSTGIGFFAIRAQERDPVAYEFHLKSYEDLLDLDIPAILEGAPGYRLFQRQQPLYLVCTNGRRDQCCARFGFPLFTELRRLAEGQVWQVTHVGGHRFAANLYCLPHGLLYGRLQAGDATAIIESYKHGQILLEHYRGRTCYAQIAQVADYFLRRSSQDVGIGSFHLEGAEEIDPRRWRVQFSATSGQVHRLTLAVEQTDEQVYESCLMDKTTLLFEHSLINHEIF